MQVSDLAQLTFFELEDEEGLEDVVVQTLDVVEACQLFFLLALVWG